MTEPPRKPDPAAPSAPEASEASAAPGTGAGAPAGKPGVGAPAGKPGAPAAKAAGAGSKPAPKAEPKAPPPPPGPPDPEPPADLARPEWLQAFERDFPGVGQVSYWVGDWTIIVPVDRLTEALTWLRDAPAARFDYCSDVTAVDWPPREARFDIVYSLYSIPHRCRARVKVRVADGQPVPTATGIWPAVNWFEREVYDLFGVPFTDHPDLRRLLMPEEWQGHPQRKDYPLEGEGELLLENPLEWLKIRRDAEEAEFE